MKVNVVGKNSVSGTSKKTGKDFAGTVVHVVYKKNGVEGTAVETVWLDPKTYPLASIQVGKTYDLDRDGNGYVVGFEMA